MGIANNTINMYCTDNDPHKDSWPDAAFSPFRSEKNQPEMRLGCLFEITLIPDYITASFYTFLIAATPGNSLPSIYSSMAPPPVDT